MRDRAEPNEAFGWPAWWPLALFAAFCVVATALYRGALTAPFLSDDIAYLVTHPYTSPLTAANVWEILDPWGPAKLYAANYAPVHLLLTALELHIFADAYPSYHLVNVAIHAANGVLLVAWLRLMGIGGIAAVVAGLFFVVHPANVEAVAWASQLKTNAALALSLGALVACRRSPPLAAGLFALALLTKASALFALPTLAAWLWSDRDATRRSWVWLGVWAAIAALYAVPQFASFSHLGQVEVAAYADPWVQLRTVAAIGARYLVMAPTAIGVSAWQEPDPALSWLDPWWLVSLPLAALLGWRLLDGLRCRRPEAVFWVAAAAAFAPVSQVFPFPIPMADRYLYFILPGLVGGTLLFARDWFGAAAASRPWLTRAVLAVALATIVFFGWQSSSRARLWQSETLLLLDAARHFPQGATAHILRARSAAQQGDVDTAVGALRQAATRGVDRFLALERDPGLAPIRNTPEFRALIRDMAGDWIALANERGYTTQPELRFMGIAHLMREEYDEAVAAFEASLAAGGPQSDTVREELAAAKARREAVSGAAPGGGRGSR